MVKYIKKIPDYSITVDAETLQKMLYIMSKYSKEFTAFLYAERIENDFYIHTPFFPVQTNTAVDTTIDSDDLINCMINEGMDLGRINGHIHTHPRMGTNPSGKDEEEIVERGIGNFDAALIINEDLDIFGHIVLGNEGLYIKDVPVWINYPENFDHEAYLLDKIKNAENLKEVETLMKQKEFDSFCKLYPLSLTEKQELDRHIKEKFKSPPSRIGYGFKGRNAWNNPIKKANSWDNKKSVDAWDEESVDDWDQKSWDDWDEESDDVWNQKSISRMTDEEWEEYCYFNGL